MSTASGVRFDLVCRSMGVPVPVPEYKFAVAIGRKWAFDWAWPRYFVALEVDGGAFMKGNQGAHTTGPAFRKDIEKSNAAQVAGWLVIRTLPENLHSAVTIEFVRRALALRRVL